ncbi:hypothetical protein Q2T83_07795 [Fervidibacter sacchari]|uniref:Uncharacterized protein n=1 Tax=Candidatus Fervidibacter sacchari TaxID=1448929 RepID=A0ABT2EKQ4_9BACT|nr:hypothetical protein [Candidatus Fervidibacter sacchari]MCS3918522.1 hypothetical protein [Candidatus Fervidibacter sacchari]WKU17711.1 hypothetical protein Q2T83_07795 [Candidatus Fervidibacter sacchari]
MGQGTWDKGNWEGEAPAEPKRQRIAISEWRIDNSEWRMVNDFDHPPEVGGYKFKAG